jgi:hypothetical protein
MNLKAIGKISNELASKYVEIFGVINAKDEAVLFCDYCEFDIPLNHIFYSVRDRNEKLYNTSGIILKAISQEFALPYDYIPKGHKTVCKFKCTDQIASALIEELPTIQNWNATNCFLIFF